MFGLFKKKAPVNPALQMFDELGGMAKLIVEAASADNDLEIALRGASTISPIIAEARKAFGLEVKSETIFANYLIALRDKDLQTLADMTLKMAESLNQVGSRQHKGALIHFWFNGNG